MGRKPEKSPFSQLSLAGTVARISANSRKRQPSYEAKKKVLSLMIGPPMFTPNWLWLNSGGSLGTPPTTSRYELRAVRPSLRKKPKAVPWKRLLPDFEVMFTTPPVTP